MSITFAFPTSATLAGARDLNRIHRAVGQEDLGFKIERAISALNDLQSSVSLLNSAVSLLNSAVVESGSVSGPLLSTESLELGSLSNFRAT